jgi:hypothetical protein
LLPRPDHSIIICVANSLSNLFSRLLKREFGDGQTDQAVAADLRKTPREPAGTTARIEWFDDNGVCRSKPVAIQNVSAEGISFVVTEEFPIDQTLWVETDTNEMTKMVVRHCLSEGNYCVIGAYRVGQERRRSDRFPVAGEATLRWGDSQVGLSETKVKVRNATEFGMQIESTIPLPEGTIVQLIGADLQCDGSTCYCREADDKFLIGLHLVRQAYKRESLDFKGD